MMLEAGQSEARALAYIAEAKKLIPNKPIRYVMNTHAHSDHTGGLPALVAEGATIVTQKNNETFFERALNTPRTLLDRHAGEESEEGQGRSRVGERRSTRTARAPSSCTTSLRCRTRTACWSPTSRRRRCCSRATSRCRRRGSRRNDHVKALVPALEKLKLDFDRYINVHASAAPQTKAELWKAAGR